MAIAKGFFILRILSRHVSRFLLLGICLLLLTAVYWNGLHGSYFFDDGPNIVNKPGIALDTLSWTSFKDIWLSSGAGPLGRPVAQISFALNYYAAGFDPFYFKLTNLVIHFANGLLVFALLSVLLQVAQPGREVPPILPTILMLLWLLHPIQLLAVLHVTQRMTSLSAFFLLAAVLCHIHWRRDNYVAGLGWLGCAWLVLWPLSIFSKESGVLFPMFVAAWEMFIRPMQAGRVDRFGRNYLLLCLSACAIVLFYGFSASGQWLWQGYEYRPFSLWERLLTESRVIFFYLGQIFVPHFESFGLFHDDMPRSSSLLTPWSTLPAVFGVLAMPWLIFRLRRNYPLVVFGIAWFVIGHLIESTALPLELVHEHRNYLPLVGIVIMLAGGGAMLSKRFQEQRSLVVLLGMVAIAYLGFVTALRSHQFADEFRRTQLEAQHHRASARAQNDAGRLLSEFAAVDGSLAPTYGLARRHFELAVELDQDIKISLLGLIYLNCSVGLPAEAGWIAELARRLRYTPVAPGDQTVLYSLRGMQIERRLCLKRDDLAVLFIAALSNASAGRGVRAMFHSWYADYLWLGERDLPAASAELDRSLELAPGNPSNLLKRAQLHFLAGEAGRGIAMLEKIDEKYLSVDERETRTELLAGPIVEAVKK